MSRMLVLHSPRLVDVSRDESSSCQSAVFSCAYCHLPDQTVQNEKENKDWTTRLRN